MYYYILGCGIACLILFGINSMDTVCSRTHLVCDYDRRNGEREPYLFKQ